MSSQNDGHHRESTETGARATRRWPLVGALVLVLALAAIAAGCGGDDEEALPEETTAEEWASDVCGAVAGWKDELTTLATDFGSGISEDELTAKVEEAETLTSDLVDELKAIGTPDTEAAEQAKAELEAFGDDLETSIDSIKAQAEGLTDSGVSGFLSGIGEIATELGRLVDEGRETFDTVEELDAGGELADALENDETCQSLRE